MSIKIIADSLSDIPSHLIKEYDIDIIPLTIIFEDGEYKDRVDISVDEFYEKLKTSSTLPRTSQVTPVEFENIFKKYLDQGREILYIGASSKASGTYQSSVIAKDMLESEKIHIFDTMALCGGIAMLVIEAGKMAKEGKSINEIIEKLKEMKEKIDHVFTVDTLEYLQKGGRLSATKAAIGTILNIKPILTVEDGVVKPLDQVRGKKKVIEKMIELSKKRGQSFENKTVMIYHAKNIQLAEKLKEAVESELNPKEIIMGEIGAGIGTHAGPGTVAIFYLR
ncbi:EDD domain protein, DegV family [Alkalithermobacter thermoalcaliphilus JW-YL-7 = DSM 7308]|uniref:DegV family protein n=1 Tax=Alkalithermobacter thermoalcaliphilus JW-YL-7 = DSM 7308 TaxID=1121328 RepID=A0A150FQI8_CLOPD|nr:degV family protein [[Clostridium] paradoxum JW-YL-7 = DSM 7308]SHK84045.1 EDD domain protein, DegV family [[Clostridium] paradoxum JW-YL-7 = DSM 7308]